MEESFLWKVGITLMDMRLIAEGAAVRYKNDAGTVIRVAREKEQYEAAHAVDDVGTAVYALRDHIYDLQMAHLREVRRVEGE